MIKVKGYNGLYRDETTDAIINMNDNSYDEYLKIKHRLINNQNRLTKIEDDISEIKTMLKAILQK
jgi:hypothetical protein